MNLDKELFFELLNDLDKVRGQIGKIQEKITKLYISNAKSHPTVYKINKDKTKKK